jgi:hypothetical protein
VNFGTPRGLGGEYAIWVLLTTITRIEERQMAAGEVTEELRIDEVRLIARSTHLPVDDRELAVLGDYLDAFEVGRANDHVLYLQVQSKARAYIAQRLVERPRWDSGLDGAIGVMTAELRERLLTTANT